MSERIARWIGGGMVVGLLPFGIAWLVRRYYLGYAPVWSDVLGTG